MNEKVFYEIQNIKLTYAAASEATARVLIDAHVEAEGYSMVDLTVKIMKALGFKS